MGGGILVQLRLGGLNLLFGDARFHPDFTRHTGIQNLVESRGRHHAHGETIARLGGHGTRVVGTSAALNITQGRGEGLHHAQKSADAAEQFLAAFGGEALIALGTASGGRPLFGHGVGVGNHGLEKGHAIGHRRGGPRQCPRRDVRDRLVEGVGVQGHVILQPRRRRRGTPNCFCHVPLLR